MKRTLIAPPLLAGLLLLLLYGLCSRARPMQAAPIATFGNAPAPVTLQAQRAVTNPLPDLAITQITFSPPNPTGNTVGDITVIIQNQGNAPTSGFRYYLYVDPAEVPPTATTSATTRGYFGVPLAPGESITWTRTSHLFTSEAPRVYAWVDPTWEDTVVESDESNNLFPNPDAAIVEVAPPAATVGTTVTLTINAEKSHFLPTVTSADLGAGITISAVDVISPTQALVTVAIAEEARAGSRAVQLMTGAEQLRQNAAFTVTRPTPARALTAISPEQAMSGRTLTVTVTASNTHFVAGESTLTMGNGITTSGIQVISPTVLVATATIAADAMPGARLVTVQTGTEVVTRSAGFQVLPENSAGAVLYIEPMAATLAVSATESLTIMLAPGITAVNGVQIHGQVDPLYLRLVDVITTVTPLIQAMEPITFDGATGEFIYSVGELGAGGLGADEATPFPVLTLVVQALRPTEDGGTAVRFLSDFPATDVTDAEGSILAEARDGTVRISEAETMATIQGHVDLQGRPLRPDASWATLLTIELRPTSGSTVSSRHLVMTDERGDFALPAVPTGDYTIWVKGEHTLANRVEKIVLQPGINQIYLGTLLEGDAETETSRNHITVRDFSLVSDAFGSCVGDEAFIPNSDLTQDGCVTIADATLVQANYNRQGDLVYDITEGMPAPLAAAERFATLRFLASSALTRAANSGSPITVNSVLTIPVATTTLLPLFVDPKAADPILGVTASFAFDPQLVEVVDLYLNSTVPIEQLGTVQIDNEGGRVRFSVQSKAGQPITHLLQLGYIRVKLKGATTGTVIYPLVNAPGQTNITGANGTLLARADSITLISSAVAIGGESHSLFLPFVAR